MKINIDILEAAAKYVTGYFAHKLDSKFTYHNCSHTGYVVRSVKKLCAIMKVKEHEMNLLSVAAWFHDLGFTKQIEGHEQIGAQLAEEFLLANKVDEKEITLVKSCILATRYPQYPTTILEQIICDADLMYLGDKDFFKISANLRQEWEFTKSITYSDADWYRMNLNFISFHRFHTRYAFSNVERQRNKTVKILEMKLIPSLCA